MAISHLFPEEGPTLNLNFAGSRTLDPRITFTRTQTTSNGSTYMGRDGLVKYAGPDEPRFDHRYVNGEIESLGLLIEEQRVNYALRSQEFNLSPNLAVNASISPNAAIAPDGTLTADKLVEDNISSIYKRVQQSGFTVSGDYTVSFFVKEAGRYRGYIQLLNTTNASVSFNLQEESVSGIVPEKTKIEKYPNGWYRVSTSNTFNAGETPTVYIVMLDGAGNPTYVGDGSSGLYIWGLQVEQGSFPTSYIHTEGSTKTRTKDVPQMVGTNLTDWFSSTEGTFIINHRWNTLDTFVDSLFAVSTDGGGSGINLYDVTSAAYGAGLEYPGTNNFVKILSPEYYKYGLTYNTTSRATVVNGGGVVEDNNAFTSLNTVNRFSIGMDRGNNWQGSKTIAQLTYYPTRLSNSQLVALTR